MPTLAYILIAYYVLATVCQIAKGPHVAVYTPLRAAVGVIIALVLTDIWFSLPVCGGLPTLPIILIGLGWLVQFLALFGIGNEVSVTPGSIALSSLFAGAVVLILLNLNYC